MQNNEIGDLENMRKLQQEYAHLSREDLMAEIAKDLVLFKELQQRIRKNKEKLRKWLTLMG